MWAAAALAKVARAYLPGLRPRAKAASAPTEAARLPPTTLVRQQAGATSRANCNRAPLFARPKFRPILAGPKPELKVAQIWHKIRNQIWFCQIGAGGNKSAALEFCRPNKSRLISLLLSKPSLKCANQEHHRFWPETALTVR